jgi:hypothetical protein
MSYELVWYGLKLKYPAVRSVPIHSFVKSNRARIIKDLERESIRVATKKEIERILKE